MMIENFTLFAKRFKEPILLLQDNGTILSVNPACMQLFGINEEHLVNKNLAEFINESADKINRYLLLWKSTGDYLPGGFSLKNTDDAEESITLEGCLLKPRTHRGPALIIVKAFPKSRSIKSFSILNEKVAQLTREIHEKNRIEKGLRESEQKVLLLLQSTAEAIYGVNEQGICTFANKALLEMLELKDETAIVGKRMHSFLHHSDIHGNKISEAHSPVYQAYRHQTASHDDNSLIWRPDGSFVPVEYWAYPITSNHKSLGAVVTIINITERQQISNALQTIAEGTSGVMGETFFENCAISLADIHAVKTVIIGEIQLETPDFLETISFVTQQQNKPKARFKLNSKQLQVLSLGNCYTTNPQDDANSGEDAFLAIENVKHYYATPLLSSGGKLLGLILLANDTPVFMSERAKSILPVFGKRIAMELEQRETTKSLHDYQDHLEALVSQRTRELEQAYRDLESYSYSIAHDLRTPLRSITSFSQILRDDLHGKLDEGEADFLNRIIKSSEFMAELISDILELSRITRSELSLDTINLSEMVRNIIDDKLELQPERKFQIRISDNVFVKGDPKLFYVVMDNLIENAIKFSRNREITQIEFTCRENTDGRLICYIKDNGAGFNSDYKEKLFTPFQRLHKRDEFEGTGIGLATVKRILERHNGDIWVDSEVDKGACFYFICPSLHLKT